MKCLAARKIFSAYIDDELAPEQREAVNLHLRECEVCRNEFEELFAVHTLFAGAERFSAPFGFSTRVMANLEERKKSIWHGFFARPLLFRSVEVTFAMIIVVIGLISGSLLMSHRPSTVTSAEVRQSFALNVFEAAPSGSMGGIYVSMTGVRNAR